MNKVYSHQPVLYQEIIHALNPFSGGRFVDGTLGAGGHASGILEASGPEGELLGLDVDPQAINLASRNLQEFGSRVRIMLSSYTALLSCLAEIGWEKIDGMVLDLGASSMQFDNPDSGFSFQSDGELDMRFDPSNSRTAHVVVNEYSESDLADILYRFGEEPKSKSIAHAIVQARPINGTVQLASVISSVYSSRGKIHPATKSFQAIRIEVNSELDAIESVLPQATAALSEGGRLAVISFHSLEDRIIKSYFRLESKDCVCPPKQPVCTCGHKATLREINRKPIMASDEEIQRNPRSRSAKLRIVEKLDTK